MKCGLLCMPHLYTRLMICWHFNHHYTRDSQWLINDFSRIKGKRVIFPGSCVILAGQSITVEDIWDFHQNLGVTNFYLEKDWPIFDKVLRMIQCKKWLAEKNKKETLQRDIRLISALQSHVRIETRSVIIWEITMFYIWSMVYNIVYKKCLIYRTYHRGKII